MIDSFQELELRPRIQVDGKIGEVSVEDTEGCIDTSCSNRDR